ncbi:cytochrome c oxidase assembly protein [Longimycelium tulufanense]|uniref:cytochrome c oxidase assembly protein n=1 Tax=Longimycelium tulufanense TaxID=907463 RepID=UPI00166D6BF5|nr:cytochrome c oxidase assembly protein [Longimycelium tulufanense]
MTATENARTPRHIQKTGTIGGAVVHEPYRDDVRRAFALGVIAVAASLFLAGVALWFGGAVNATVIPGLPDPGPETRWALPISRVLADLAAAGTVGFLLAAAVLAPLPAHSRAENHGDGRENLGGVRRIGSTAGRWVRSAGWLAAVWLVAALAGAGYTLSDVLARPLGEVISDSAVWPLVFDLDAVTTLLVVATIAAALTLSCRVVSSVRGTTVLLLLAVVGVLPPAFSGHAAGAGSHQIAVSSMLLHVVGVVLWTGGLLALALAGRLPTTDLARAAHRYSRLAAWCLALVVISGVLTLAGRLWPPAALWESRYGWLVLAKVAALGALAGFGLLHRRRTLPALAGGSRTAFRRLALVELVVFAGTIGLAVGLSRTPPPAGEPTANTTTALLGFEMPGPPTMESILLDWSPEPIFLGLAVIAVAGYVAGVRRLRQRGEPWPVVRTVSWLAAWCIVALATSSGLARYGYVLFSAHQVQHAMLSLLAPTLLVVGRPVTLALRALPTEADRRWPGPREWLSTGLKARRARWILHPHIAMAVHMVASVGMYFLGLYEVMLRSHALHLSLFGLALVSGYVFWWGAVGLDENPCRPGRRQRAMLLTMAVSMPVFLGLGVLGKTTSAGADWFAQLGRPWGPSVLADQRLGGVILAIGTTALTLFVVAGILLGARTRREPEGA